MFPKESRGPYLGSGVASSWEHETAAVQYTADRCLVRSMSRPMSCGSCRFFLRTFLTSVFLLGQHSRQERQLPPISFFFCFREGPTETPKHRAFRWVGHYRRSPPLPPPRPQSPGQQPPRRPLGRRRASGSPTHCGEMLLSSAKLDRLE